jgi:ABC-type branched-subunit amino acid transport system ATPase component
MMLQIDGVSLAFSGLKALCDVGFDVRPGEIRAVIGPNGAGKTTLFNVITGVLAPDTGTVRFGGESIAGRAPHAIARRGLGRTFQQAQLYRSLTVLDNVMLGTHARGRAGILACALGVGRAAIEEGQSREEARHCLALVGMAGQESRIASELPLGEQRYLEIARALATRPKLLLLDEPAAGLNDSEADALAVLLMKVRDAGVTLLVIEHHMRFVMQVSDNIVVLDFGRKIADAPPAAVRADPAVIAAYLGGDDEDENACTPGAT